MYRVLLSFARNCQRHQFAWNENNGWKFFANLIFSSQLLPGGSHSRFLHSIRILLLDVAWCTSVRGAQRCATNFETALYGRTHTHTEPQHRCWRRRWGVDFPLIDCLLFFRNAPIAFIVVDRFFPLYLSSLCSFWLSKTSLTFICTYGRNCCGLPPGKISLVSYFAGLRFFFLLKRPSFFRNFWPA